MVRIIRTKPRKKTLLEKLDNPFTALTALTLFFALGWYSLQTYEPKDMHGNTKAEVDAFYAQFDEKPLEDMTPQEQLVWLYEGE